MPTKCEEYDGVGVLAVQGDLATDEAAAARRTVEEAIERRHIASFVVDLEKCPFVDSEGLEMLLWIRQRCEELFGQFKIANADENVRKILEMTRLTHRLPVHGDLHGALKQMR